MELWIKKSRRTKRSLPPTYFNPPLRSNISPLETGTKILVKKNQEKIREILWTFKIRSDFLHFDKFFGCDRNMAEFYNHAVTITPVMPNNAPIEEDTSTWTKCEFCDYKCPKKDRLSRHVRNVHFKEKPHFCHLCDATFGRKDKLKRHLATVHSPEKPFKCDYCPHSSGRKDKIREHIQSVHLKTRPRKSHKKKVKDEEQPTLITPGLPSQPIPRHDLVTLTPLSLVVPSQAYLSAYDHHPGLAASILNQPMI